MRRKESFRGLGEEYNSQQSTVGVSVSYNLGSDLARPVELGWRAPCPPPAVRASRQPDPDRNFLKRLASKNHRPLRG